jgi:hypothetical protein
MRDSNLELQSDEQSQKPIFMHRKCVRDDDVSTLSNTDDLAFPV